MAFNREAWPLAVFTVIRFSSGHHESGLLVLAVQQPPSLLEMTLVILLENLAGGMGTAAFVALLMSLCDQRFTATQFALLSALARWVGSGWGLSLATLQPTTAGQVFFSAPSVAALPGLWLVWRLRVELRL